MAERFFSSRNLRFLLYEVLDVESLTQHEYYADHDRETFDLTLEAASRMASDMLHPYLGEIDREPPEYSNGSVSVHSSVRGFLRACGEGGWVCATSSYDVGGQQLPVSIAAAVRFIFAAANYSMSVYPMLTSSAGRLIESFGDAFLAETYLPKMYSGEWQGTMALTESQAGSSLSDVCTRAAPTDDDYYLINGQKIFISAGDHDAVDNVVHFVLARVQGSSPGVKGISLFLVPKLRVADDGTLVPNTELGHIHYKRRIAERVVAARLVEEEDMELKRWAKRLNGYLAMIHRAFFPTRIILGGGISKEFDEWAQWLDMPCEVVAAELRNQAGIVGAALRAAETEAQ